MKDKNAILISIIVLLFCAVTDGFQTGFSLYSQTPKDIGGLEYTPAKLGSILLVAGIIIVICDMLFIGKSIVFLGLKRGILLFNALMIFGIGSIVSVNIFTTKVAFVLYALNIAFVRVCVSGMRVSMTAIIMSVIPGHLMGVFFSARNCFGAIGGGLGPIITGSLFAWSLKNEKSANDDAIGFPFNHVFAFFFLAILTLACLTCASMLPDNIKREE